MDSTKVVSLLFLITITVWINVATGTRQSKMKAEKAPVTRETPTGQEEYPDHEGRILRRRGGGGGGGGGGASGSGRNAGRDTDRDTDHTTRPFPCTTYLQQTHNPLCNGGHHRDRSAAGPSLHPSSFNNAAVLATLWLVIYRMFVPVSAGSDDNHGSTSKTTFSRLNEVQSSELISVLSYVGNGQVCLPKIFQMMIKSDDDAMIDNWFEIIDSDQDGRISATDLAKFFIGLLHEKALTSESKAIIRKGMTNAMVTTGSDGNRTTKYISKSGKEREEKSQAYAATRFILEFTNLVKKRDTCGRQN